MKACQCGCVSFTKNVRVTGIWVVSLTVEDDGTITREGNGDCTRNLDEPKTIRCDACNKRYPNPDYK